MTKPSQAKIAGVIILVLVLATMFALIFLNKMKGTTGKVSDGIFRGIGPMWSNPNSTTVKSQAGSSVDSIESDLDSINIDEVDTDFSDLDTRINDL